MSEQAGGEGSVAVGCWAVTWTLLYWTMASLTVVGIWTGWID